MKKIMITTSALTLFIGAAMATEVNSYISVSDYTGGLNYDSSVSYSSNTATSLVTINNTTANITSANGSNIVINNTLSESNTWRTTAGGLLRSVKSAVDITSASFQNNNVTTTNTTGGNYGAVLQYADNSSGTIKNSEFINNFSTTNAVAQGIVNVSSSTVTFDNVTFKANTSKAQYNTPAATETAMGAIAMFASEMNIKNSVFDSNKAEADYYARGGAIYAQNNRWGGFENTIINIENTKFIKNSAVSISQDIWGDEYGYGDGGAVYFGASEGYGPITATIKDTQFTGNTANKGGAIVTARDNSTSFVLSENKSILNAGNKALNDARGGFLYASKNSTINFDIANASTYTIGDGSVNCDSIASADNSSTINKTGVGTLVVNGSMQYFTGTLNVNAGTMEVNNGLGAKVITIANGATVGVQINGNNMLSNSELAFTNNGTLILSSKAGLEAGDYTVSVANITDYGTTKTYGGVLSGNTFTVANAKQIEAGAEAPTVVENNGIVEITTNESTSVSMAFNADSATVNKVSEVTSDLLQTFGSDFVASGAFDFDVSLEAGDTVVLSFYVGDSTLKLGDFSIYHKAEGSQWESADDISNVSYDGEYLSFIASHFSSYGYTAVPEPAEWAMVLGAIALSFVAYRRRK